jgi:hypothetical protein
VRIRKRWREREIKEMGVESGQRRRVLGITNYSGTDGKKNCSRRMRKMKGEE